MNTKITLIEQVLQEDYYAGKIEEGSLKNNSFTIWTQGTKYADLVYGDSLISVLRKQDWANFIKDDGAVILTFKLTEKESTYVAGLLKHKKDAEGFNLYRIDWTDDRDFRSESEKQFDKLCSSVELSIGNVKFYKRENNNRLGDISFENAIDKLEAALKLIKEANKELL